MASVAVCAFGFGVVCLFGCLAVCLVWICGCLCLWWFGLCLLVWWVFGLRCFCVCCVRVARLVVMLINLLVLQFESLVCVIVLFSAGMWFACLLFVKFLLRAFMWVCVCLLFAF